ncbi:hypothetical protein I4U23_005861 [Adineta vaga]|nr:hypothetical protein I4U23_005861 [Adineta vaga]
MNYFLYLVLAIGVVGYTSGLNWNQRWEYEFLKHFGFNLRNERSGKCLDVPDNEVFQNGARIQQWDCLRSKN